MNTLSNLRVCGTVSNFELDRQELVSRTRDETKVKALHNAIQQVPASPGLVVKGGDSKSEGFELASRCQTLDGNFSHQFVVKFVLFV